MARGKVILLGEHGVVYGRPALAGALERGVRATASAAERDLLVLEPWGLAHAPDPSAPDLTAQAFAALLAAYKPPTPARIECDIALPAGAGLGCSAAIGVAVVTALDELLGVERERSERAALALAWERVFHGNPSGVDTALAASGGVAVFRRGEPLEPVALRAPLTLVVGHSGESSSTKAMVAAVAKQHERHPARVEKIFDGMAALVRNGQLALTAGELRAFGQLMDLNQALLNTLMLSTANLEEMCQVARAAGALGAKITGAGGGGCMIALVDGVESAAAVEASLAGFGQGAFVVEVGA